MRKLQTLFKEFINAPIQIYSGATFKKGLYDLLDVYSNTESGDLVIVKGNHDVGDNSIELKDGVNWEFKGYPTISSDSANGTFKDGGVAVGVHFDSDVRIVNTNLQIRAIYLTNSSSLLNGQPLKKLIVRLYLNGGSSNNDDFINEVGEYTLSNPVTGSYWLTFSNSFIDAVFFSMPEVQQKSDGTGGSIMVAVSSSSDKIKIDLYDTIADEEYAGSLDLSLSVFVKSYN